MSEYKGPNSTLELEALLNESPNSVLKALSKENKESLVKCAVFNDNRLRGFENADDNIKHLNSTNMLEILSAILQGVVVAGDGSSSSSIEFRTGDYSYCSNCFWYRDHDDCCNVGGDGCIDDFSIPNCTE